MKQTMLVYEIELQDMLNFQLIIYDERIDWIMSYNTGKLITISLEV